MWSVWPHLDFSTTMDQLLVNISADFVRWHNCILPDSSWVFFILCIAKWPRRLKRVTNDSRMLVLATGYHYIFPVAFLWVETGITGSEPQWTKRLVHLQNNVQFKTCWQHVLQSMPVPYIIEEVADEGYRHIKRNARFSSYCKYVRGPAVIWHTRSHSKGPGR